MGPLRPSLRLRVAAGFALLGLAVSLALGGWLYVASRDLEQHLIDEALGAELEDYLARLARNPQSLPPQTATIRGYVARSAEDAKPAGEGPPPELAHLPEGRFTLQLDGASYRVAVHQGPDATLYMLHSRAQLAHREQRFALLLILGMTLTAILSAGGGWWLAGRVTAPVRDLAERVRGREPDDPPAPLGAGLPDDEVGELARTIDRYLRRLRAFVERERTFVSSVSHELRTPLAVIQGAVEVLESDPNLARPTQERLGRIGRAARGMADLTTALLVLAREGQGQTNPPTPCDLGEVLAECVELHRPLLRHKPVTLGCHIEARPVLEVARPLAAIAIGNLLRNACTYTERGQIQVTLSQSEVRVDDTGPGIPPEELDCLFAEDLGCRRTVRGEGIGLPLVKRIAESQGWRISVESRAGEGASFRLQFAPGETAAALPSERI
jgi:signal transduction histidine kinase